MSSQPRNLALGLDIGGTRCRAGAVTADGRIVAAAHAPTPEQGERGQLVAVVRQLVGEVTAGAEPTTPTVGVAVPGIRDAESGVMLRANNLRRLEGADVRRLFSETLQRPVCIESDVNAAGWAQWRHTTPLPRRFVYVSIGTGVGGCVILDGKIVRHTHGGAGHFCDLIVDTSVDAAADKRAIPGNFESQVVGDAHPARVVRALAIGLHQIASIYAPDTIALGGGVIDHLPELIEQENAAFSDLRAGLSFGPIAIRRAPLPSDEAGVIGVALLASESAQ